jgi:hypothetical protein
MLASMASMPPLPALGVGGLEGWREREKWVEEKDTMVLRCPVLE